jgi:hypothetical protein
VAVGVVSVVTRPAPKRRRSDVWNPFKRKQWAGTKEPEKQKEAQEDAKEDLELADKNAEDVAGGLNKKWE